MAAAVDFAHTPAADQMRQAKALKLAQFAWHRGLTAHDLRTLSSPRLRKLAQAAKVNPPSTMETWSIAADLVDQKDHWTTRHPDHPSATRRHPEEKIQWTTPPPN